MNICKRSVNIFRFTAVLAFRGIVYSVYSIYSNFLIVVQRTKIVIGVLKELGQLRGFLYGSASYMTICCKLVQCVN